MGNSNAISFGAQTLFIPIPRRTILADLNAVYSTRLCNRTPSELGPPTTSLHGKSVAC